MVIYQENVSFHHYFGTYPHAANIDGQPLTAQPDTPAVNGLTSELLTRNPNSVAADAAGRTGGAGDLRPEPRIPGRCGDPAAVIDYQGRCGYGPRLPLLLISPYARANFVDHTLTDQTPILQFIEDNWSTGRIGDHSRDERAGPLGGMFAT